MCKYIYSKYTCIYIYILKIDILYIIYILYVFYNIHSTSSPAQGGGGRFNDRKL